MAKTVRTTISLPKDLKHRMRDVEEVVNWSAIACRAFEEKLVEITAKKQEKTMSDIIARLSVSKRRNDNNRYNGGFAAGERWAMHVAEADELQRLENFQQELGFDFEDDGRSAYSSSERFVFVIRPETDSDRKSASAFWEEHWEEQEHSGEQPQDILVRGFAEGAFDVWMRVKDDID